MLDAVVKLSVVVNFVLFGDFSDPRREFDYSSVLEEICDLRQKLVVRLNMALGRVERSKDHRFSLSVLEEAVLVSVKHGVHKGIALLALATQYGVAIIARCAGIRVLATYVVLFSLSEQLDGFLCICHPRVGKDLAC